MMQETSNETQEDSPLQALLEGASLFLRFDRLLKELDEKPTTHDEVQGAANADN
jgi:hypothetical protein